jgi:hypothetical protein
MSCRFAHDDAAYVLGALSPAERLAFEEHLADCRECSASVQQLAGLPGLLGRVDKSVLEDPGPDPSVPDTLLPSLTREVGRRTRTRTFATAGLAAAAAAVIAIGVPVVASQVGADHHDHPTTSAGPTPGAVAPRPMTAVGEAPVQATLGLEPATWGTQLRLACRYDPKMVAYHLPGSAHYSLFVRTRQGTTQEVGSWRSVGGKTMHLSAATSAAVADIAAVEVRTPNGHVVLRLRT